MVPTGKRVVVNVATSFKTVPLPIFVEPLKKFTVPRVRQRRRWRE